MALYAITGRNIFRNQACNKRMQKDMSECFSDVRTRTSIASRDLGNLTKNTQISQTSEVLSRKSCDIASNGSVIAAEARSSFSSLHNVSQSVHPKSVAIQIHHYSSDDNAASGIPSPPRTHNGHLPRVTTTVTTGPDRAKSGIMLTTPITPRMTAKMNRGARVYAQVAFLLYVVMLIVWVPSTVNRAYSLAEPNKINFGLNLAASVVLPLQGFFNTIIYIFTSRKELMTLYRRVTGRRRVDEDDQIREVVRGESEAVSPDMPWSKDGSVASADTQSRTYNSISLDDMPSEADQPAYPWTLNNTTESNARRDGDEV
jgi:hypothetical protein